jgi:transcriptional regulator with XRE-family HTH domain
MQRLVNPLRALRVNRKAPLTLRQLSEKTGFTVGHLSNVERGLHGAGDRLIAQLSRVYGESMPRMRKICESVYNARHAA